MDDWVANNCDWILDEIGPRTKSTRPGQKYYWELDFVNVDTGKRYSTHISNKLFNNTHWQEIIEYEQYGLYAFNKKDPLAHKPKSMISSHGGFIVDADSKPILARSTDSDTCKRVLRKLEKERYA